MPVGSLCLALVAGFLVPGPAGAAARACNGEAATIVGTSGDDTIAGTPDDDVIVGLAGNDTVEGYEGDDVICGGRGRDTMREGPGRDQLRGGQANDLVSFEDDSIAVQVVLPARGRPGRASRAERPTEVDVLVGVESVEGTNYGDWIQGSEARNRLIAGDGDDVILGEGGDDEIEGGAGQDSIDGGAQPDTLSGGPGNDAISGGGSRDGAYFLTIDVLSGGAGDDILRGDTGRDELVGGPGDDELDGGSSPPGVLSGDSVSYAASPVGVTASLAAESATGEGTDVLIDIEAIEGSAFDDVLTGNAKLNHVDAGLGNDELYGGYGIDFLFPGEGRNVVDGGRGGESEDQGDFVMYVFNPGGVRISSEPSESAEQITNVEVIFGSHYDDVIAGGPDADRIFSWGGDDHISGGGGDDYLDPGGDDDEVDGGEGHDACSDSAEQMINCEQVVQSSQD